MLAILQMNRCVGIAYGISGVNVYLVIQQSISLN